MPSPFPGMDPYLEKPGHWADCHSSLILAIRAALNTLLPARYVATTETHVWSEDDEEIRVMLGGPDIQAVDLSGKPMNGGATVMTPPRIVRLRKPAAIRQRYVQVLDADRNRVVTAIELLSPANKTFGRTGEAYRHKRAEYLEAGLNLVEIDLLRRGVRPDLGVPAAASDYYSLICRGHEFPDAGIWGFSVREPLPPVPVPLDADESDIVIDLKACLERVYQEARFDKRIDYSNPPNPPLAEPDAAWAKELLASRTSANGTGT